MNPMDIMVELLSSVLPKGKIYPDVVPDAVQLPFIHYSEDIEPNVTCDGNAGATTTTVVSVSAATKAEARTLSVGVCEALNQRSVGGYVFHHQGTSYELFDQEKISNFDLTFKILKS